MEFELDRELVDHFLENKKNDAYQVIRNELWGAGAYVGIGGTILGGAPMILPASLIGMGTGFGLSRSANQVANAVYTFP